MTEHAPPADVPIVERPGWSAPHLTRLVSSYDIEAGSSPGEDGEGNAAS
jgi:hypothetical protein